MAAVGSRMSATIIRVAKALSLLSVLEVLLIERRGYRAALVASVATAAVASRMFFGYPKHSPQGAFVAAWLIMFQLLPDVRRPFFSETK
jgi:hypothetical protein